MEKFALLIGVSEYEPYLTPLPTAIKDTEALREVLLHPEMGGFASANVEILYNPSLLDMGVAIHTLFSNCQKDDLVLFFFSGHGVTDAKGRFYLSTRETRRTQTGELIPSTSIAASFIHEQMSNSRSKRQVVILDSSFSAAFSRGMGVKDDRKVDIQAQLGGKGRAVLTSSDFTEYSLYQAGEELSIYTRYLVEGIRTGAADADDDGYISIAELHEYAKNRVVEVTSNKMTPKIFYVAEEGHWIQIATTLSGASKLKFQRVEALREEFNYWLDISFKYEAKQEVDSLISSLADSLAEGLIQNVFKPCLEKWHNRSFGYFTISDLESEIVADSTKWVDSKKAKEIVEREINSWLNTILNLLKQGIFDISQKYSLSSEELESLFFDMSDEFKLDGGQISNFRGSSVSKKLIFNLTSGISATIFFGSFGILMLSAMTSVFALFLFPMLFLMYSMIFGGEKINSKLNDMLTKRSVFINRLDLPLWVRKKISSQDISDQMSQGKREFSRYLYNAIQQKIAVDQIVEKAIPSIKHSFRSSLERNLIR